MSQHLLPVKTGNEQFPVSYRNIDAATFESYYCGITCVHNAILFCVKQNIYNQYQAVAYDGRVCIDIVNLFTGEMKHYAELDYFSDMDRVTVGDIKVDDNYIYMCSAYSSNNGQDYRRILIFKLKDWSSTSLQLERVGVYGFSPNNLSGTGKLVWYDRNTLLTVTRQDVLLFDIKRHAFTPYTHNLSWDARDIAVGNDCVVFTKDSTATPTILIFNKTTKAFSTMSLPTTALACVGYNDGRFFFANANYLYIMDEATMAVTETRNIPWTAPANICVSDTSVYVLSNNSARAYIHDYVHNETQSFLLPWTIPTLSTTNNTKSVVDENFWFVYRNTLMICDYSGYSKYNFGYKYESVVVLCNMSNIQKFSYDPRFVTFTETFMFIHDGDIEYTFEPVEEIEHVKSVSISKSDYRFINSIQFKSD